MAPFPHRLVICPRPARTTSATKNLSADHKPGFWWSFTGSRVRWRISRRASLSLRGNHTLSDQPRPCANSHPSLNARRRLEGRRFAPAYCGKSGRHQPGGCRLGGSSLLLRLSGPLRFVASSQTNGDRSQLASAPCLGADAPREALQSASYSQRSYRSPLRTRIRRISTGPGPFSPPGKRKHREQAQTQEKRKS